LQNPPISRHMITVVRRLRPQETRTFLEVHHAAVHGLAAGDYPLQVIEAWAPLPVTERHVRQVKANADNELRFAAVVKREVVGIGALVAKNSELRACYVVPHAARKGIGTAIVNEIERAARLHHLSFLELDSSLMAELFYTRLGYRVLERGTHLLASGYPMACVKMRKDL
jgi:putative acetyltransferase